MLFSLVLHLFFLTQTIYADEGVNFALGKPTWQSSTEADGVSSRAVDGYKNPYYSQNSCMQTKTQYEPWWAVDLEREVFVTAVRITNRADCCWENLANFDIRVGANLTDGGKRNPQCGPTYTDDVGGGRIVTVNCGPPLLGRFVTVSIMDAGGTLNFCEVEVYGYQRHNVFSVKAISYGAKNDTDHGKLSQLIVDDMYNETFVNWGHYVISFDMTTGQKIAQKRFDTHNDSSALTMMPLYLQNLPSEIFVFVILNRAGWKYYQTSMPVLRTMSGDSNISDQLEWGDAWALLGYKGILPSPSWRNSVTKNIGYMPAVIEDVIPKLSVPPTPPPSSITMIDLTSSSFTIRWSRPPGIVTENELPLKYTVCVREPGSMADGNVVNGSMMVNSSLVNTLVNGSLLMANGSLVNGSLVNGSMVMVNVSQGNVTMFNGTLVMVNGTMMVNGSLVNCSLVNGTLVMVNGTLVMVNGTIMVNSSLVTMALINSCLANGSVTHGSLVMVNSTVSNSTLVNGSMVHDTVDNNCKSVGDATLYTMTGLRPQTKYIVSVKAHSYAGFGPETVVHVTTMQNDSRKIYVELVSRIRPDVLYRLDGQPYSSITVRGQQHNFNRHGLHFIVLHPKTGSQVMRRSFNTHRHSSSSTQIAQFLSTVPKPSIILMVVYHQAHRYYTASSLLSVCPNALSSYTRHESWSMICLYGFGSMPWATSLTSDADKGPAVIKTHILLPKELESAPNLTSVVATSSQTLQLNWTASITDNYTGDISYYQICYQRSSTPTNSSCTLTSAGSNLTEVDINGLHPYQEYRVKIRGVVALGYGPYSNALLSSTHEAAPDGPPIEARTTNVHTKRISLSWLPPDPELRNGRIIKYSICLRVVSTSPGPCLQEITRVIGSRIESITKYTMTKLNPYTKYIFNISAGTVVGFGPPVSVVSRTGQTAPSGPPTDIQVTNFTHNEMNITWLPPDPSERNGVITKYSLCIRNQSYDVCLKEDIVKFTQTSYTFSGLRPYRVYSIKIQAATVKGFGPTGSITHRAAQSEPSSGPTNIKFPRKNSSSILVTWSLPREENRNGVIQRYSVCHKLAKDRNPCNYTITDNTWFEVSGLKPYRYIKFAIKAATTVGFGPPSIAFQFTSQSAPDGPPIEARTTLVHTKRISLSWLPPDPELRNGRIIKYSICLRVVSTSPGPCLREITHVIGSRTESITKYPMTKLNPYTKYIFNISAATVVGFGPPVSVVARTGQTAPSGPPTDIQVTNFTHNEMNITWLPPDPSERNGVITKYSLCIRNQSYDFCLHEDTVKFTQTSYTFSGLRPYRVYSIKIQAATVKGFGPTGRITHRAAQSEPDGPPTKKIVKYVDESTISFSWSAPHPELYNGIIIYYHVCIRKYGHDSSCTRTVQIPRKKKKSYAYGGLSPSSEYVVVIRAATIVGLGPPAFIQKTAGECDLPVLNTAGDYVSDDSFTASGFLGRKYGPYQSPIDSDFPWCDSGLKNNAYMQIDFGVFPLRVIGVATRRHKEHWESWVSSYKLLHSLDSMEWNYVNVSGKTVIDGNADTIDGREVTHFIDEPVLTRFIRFQVLTFVGFHPCMSVQVFGCAPAMKLMTTSVLNKTAHSIQVSWTPLPSQVYNGRIFGYKICHKLTSSRLPCERSHVDHNATSYIVKELIPYTEYDIEISAGTIAGYGPSVLLSATTNESIPSGPPLHIMAQDITATSLRLVWSPPRRNHANGIIRSFGVCYQEASLGTECTKVTSVPGEQLSYEITEGLRPYTEYKLVVMAATKIKGWSPKAVLYKTTLPAAPSGAPTSVYATRIGPRILQIFWKPPEPRKQNGDIIGYRLCIKEKRSSHPCRNYVTLPESQMNMHSVDELKPFTVYNIHVEAKTVIGYGPGQYLDYRTGEAAPTAPPKDVIFKSVTTTSIEIMWSPPDLEKQNGVMAMYEVEVYQEMSGSIVEKITKSLMRENTTVWKIIDLSPRTDYIFHIRAGTAGGFGPAVIVHKRSGDRIARIDKSTGRGESKIAAEGIAGGSILLVALIAGFVFSILWNKGMLPHTRTRKLKLESQKEERRRRKRERRRQQKRKEFSEPGTEIHATYSIYSELDDYDATSGPKRKVQKRITAEDLYSTDGGDIYSTDTTNALTPDIYGTSSAPPGQDIYGNAPPGIEIYGTADPGGGINAVQKSNTLLPRIVPRPSVLPPVISLEATLSSVFIKLSSTMLNDPAFNTNADPSSRPNTHKNPSRIPSSPRSSPVPPKGKRKKNIRSPKPTFVIPEPSKFTPVIAKQKIAPVVKVDAVGSDFTSGPTFLSASMENNLPIPQPSINTDHTTDTIIESFYSGIDIAGSDLVPVTILRRNPQENVHNYTVPPTAINSNHISNIPIFRGNASFRRQSVNYHPNMPRYSIDFSASQNLDNTHKLPPIPAYPSYPKLNSEPIIYQPSDTNSK